MGGKASVREGAHGIAGRLGYSETTSHSSLPGFRTIRLKDQGYCPLGGDIRARM